MIIKYKSPTNQTKYIERLTACKLKKCSHNFYGLMILYTTITNTISNVRKTAVVFHLNPTQFVVNGKEKAGLNPKRFLFICNSNQAHIIQQPNKWFPYKINGWFGTHLSGYCAKPSTKCGNLYNVCYTFLYWDYWRFWKSVDLHPINIPSSGHCNKIIHLSSMIESSKTFEFVCIFQCFVLYFVSVYLL